MASSTSAASAAMMFVRPECAAVVQELSKRALVTGAMDPADVSITDYEGNSADRGPEFNPSG